MATVTMSNRKRIHPKKFALWLGLVSITMMFTAFTSAYIVRRAGENWLDFQLPDIFFWNTGVILASSVVLHMAYKNYIQEKYKVFKVLLITGFILGMLFVGLQYEGWMQLYDQGLTVQRNQSSSFLFLITGVHVLHVVGGIAALSIAMIYAIRPKYLEVTPKRKLRLELIFTYWHFVDFLWLYLLIFFLLQQ